MKLLPTKPQLETDLDSKNQAILSVAEAVHNLAATLSSANTAFWALPTDRLLAVLNDNVPLTLATFSANTALGTAVNAQLDTLALPQFPSRAPVEPGRNDIAFDGSAFVYVPPAEQPTPPEIESFHPPVPHPSDPT